MRCFWSPTQLCNPLCEQQLLFMWGTVGDKGLKQIVSPIGKCLNTSVVFGNAKHALAIVFHRNVVCKFWICFSPCQLRTRWGRRLRCPDQSGRAVVPVACQRRRIAEVRDRTPGVYPRCRCLAPWWLQCPLFPFPGSASSCRIGGWGVRCPSVDSQLKENTEKCVSKP